jgi:N-acetylneuraminic acid mutarotase
MFCIAKAVSISALALLVCSARAQVSGTWTATGSMAFARANFTATLLQNGRVLVTGGGNLSGGLSSAEIYDQLTGTWTSTGAMHLPRISHTAVLLPNGKVLVAGGCNADCGTAATAAAELYDPATGAWSLTGSMSTVRYYFTATLLGTGKVLVTGGCSQTNCGAVTAVSELYDPATGQWSRTGSLATARDLQTATLLANGNVLVAGGFTTSGASASAELYNPSTSRWSATASMTAARSSHSATLLGNGQVLVAGGRDPNGAILSSAELYNPANGKWSATGNMTFRRQNQTATVLASGLVLVAGGYGKSSGRSNNDLASAELYNSASGTLSATGSMTTTRSEHIAVLLPSGRVLAAGGLGTGIGYQSSAEIFTP